MLLFLIVAISLVSAINANLSSSFLHAHVNGKCLIHTLADFGMAIKRIMETLVSAMAHFEK